MKKKRICVTVITAFIFFSSARAQVNKPISHLQNRIILKPVDIDNNTGDTGIAQIREPGGRLGRFIIAVDHNGNETKYKKTEIWGYQRAGDDNIKRIYEKETYVIKEMTDVVIYASYLRHSNYFFSINPESPVGILNKANLLNALGNTGYLKLYEKSLILKRIIK